MAVSARRARQFRLGLFIALFLAPTAIGLFLFQILPMLTAIRNSFYEYNLLDPDRLTFIGLDNYTRILKDTEFFRSIANTFVYAFFKILVQLPLALGLAMLVQRPLRGIGIVRSAIFAPAVTAVSIIAVVWNLMYDPEHGMFNSLLVALGLGKQPFLTSATQAMPAIIAMSVWQDVGFTMIIFLSGLQGIPTEFYEAAAIDGAGRFQQFRHVTLPLLQRTILFALITTTIFSFQVFTPIYIMTKGGPLDSTRLAVYDIFEQGFVFLEMGYASALAVALIVLLLIIAAIQSRFLRAQFEY